MFKSKEAFIHAIAVSISQVPSTRYDEDGVEPLYFYGRGYFRDYLDEEGAVDWSIEEYMKDCIIDDAIMVARSAKKDETLGTLQKLFGVTQADIEDHIARVFGSPIVNVPKSDLIFDFSRLT